MKVSRRSRALLVALVAALVVAGAGCDPDDLNAQLEAYADGAASDELTSGVNGASVRLADERTVFLVNDAYVGPVDVNGDRTSTTKVANALVVHDPATGDTHALDGSDARGYLKPSVTTNTYTLLGATTGPTDIQIFALERNSAGATVGLRIVRVVQSTLAQSTVVTVPTRSGGPEWGSAVFKRDGYWYIYGEYSSGTETHVARTPTGTLTTTSSWRYWTGTSWSTSEAASRGLADWSGTKVARYLAPALAPDGSGVVFLGRNASVTGGALTWYSAAAPQGPLTVGGTAFTAPHQGAACGTSGTGRVVDLSYHPHLSDATHGVWSYAHTCSTATTRADEHRIRFFDAPLTTAPATPAWRASWATSLQPITTQYEDDVEDGFPTDTVLRQVVHLTRGGTQARVRISNRYGTQPLFVGAATFGVSAQPQYNTAALKTTPAPQSLTFGGAATVTVPVGQAVVSDLVTFSALPFDHDVAVSMWFPNGTGPQTAHLLQYERSWWGAGHADRTLSTTGWSMTNATDHAFFVEGVDIVDPGSAGTIVGLGDSMTDGYGTTLDAQQRWTDVLYDRLVTRGTPVASVVNVGVAGAKLLGTDPSGGTYRFDRDVLQMPGVRTVVIWLGFNDLHAGTATAAQVEAGLEALVDAAQDAGLNALVATVTPLGFATSDVREVRRQQLNDLLQANSVGADAIVDIDLVVRDPAAHNLLKASYNVGGSHLNAAGLAKLAELIDAEHAHL